MSEHTGPGGEAVAYPHVVKAVTETPWAIRPEKLAAIRELAILKASGVRLTDEEIEARVGGARGSRAPEMAGTVAVVPLYGVIFPKANLMTEMSGATSLQRFTDAFRSALNDPAVTGIVLDVDSPGGLTDMVTETASEIRGSRGRKPIVAVANVDAGSAAYWIAAQADEMVVSPSGSVGSIGIYTAHDDISGAQEKLGVKTTLVSAGKHKVESSPFAPLSDEARAHLQARVDDMYGMFVRDVAKGRGVPVDDVRSGFGEGRMVTARAAVEQGMADRVDTLDATIARVARASAKPVGQAATSLIVSGTTALPVQSWWTPPPAVITTDSTGAAESGLSFAQQAEALNSSAEALLERLTSLAEVERGHLTVAKRDRLTACTEALRHVTSELERVLAATDPNKHSAEVAQLHAHFELSRHL